MKNPFRSAADAKIGEGYSQEFPPGARLELVGPQRDHAVSVAQSLLSVMPSGGFSVTCRVGSGPDLVETRIDVPARKTDREDAA